MCGNEADGDLRSSRFSGSQPGRPAVEAHVIWLQNEAFEREKLARVAAEAERRVIADEARLAVVAAKQAAAEQVQQALAETAQREAYIRCAHACRFLASV